MPDGIKEKGDRHHRGEHGLGVAAARRVGRDGREARDRSAADNKLTCSAAVVERKCREGQQYRQ